MLSLSSYDLACLLKELQFLVDSKVDNIYVLPDNSILFRMHIKEIGKKILRINTPNIMYLTDYKPESEGAKGFCMTLRKYLNNTRLRKLNQIGFDRVAEMEFSAKENNYYVYIELFGKGNVLLCNENKKIISILNPLKTKDRTLLGGQIYEFPKSKYNFLKLTKEDLKEAIKETKQDSMVKVLAVDLQLGGKYAEEICLRAGIDKARLKISEKDIDKVFDTIKELQCLPISPHLYGNTSSPIEMMQFKNGEKYERYYELLDKLSTKVVFEEQKNRALSGYNEKIKKIENIIKKQELQLKKAIIEAEENQKKGDMLYENYTEIKKLFDNLREARKTYSWKEIKEHLKKNKKIIKIDEANNEIIIEL